MKKYLVVCILFLMTSLNGYADTLVATDTQDSSNWGDWFSYNEPAGDVYYDSPYFRFNNEDWGWIHTITFDAPPTAIISATLEIEALDVDILSQEVHEIYGDDIYMGYLEPGTDHTNESGYIAEWNVSTFTLGPDALMALVDGQMDMWIDIDAYRLVDYDIEETSGWGVQLGSSTLTVVYEADPSGEPLVPPDDPVDPPDDPVDPPDDPVDPPDDPVDEPDDPVDEPDDPVDEPDDPVDEPDDPVDPSDKPDIPWNDPNVIVKIYTFDLVDSSYPTANDTGDGIARIGQEQAWFAFDISGIPEGEQVAAASFTGSLKNYFGGPTERTLWYYSDDSWIVLTKPNESDPRNTPADYIVGKVVHSNGGYELVTIDIYHDWTKDLNDGYLSLMLTGPESGAYAAGAVEINFGKLELITVSPANQDGDGEDNGGEDNGENNSGVIFNIGKENIIQAMSIDMKVPGYSVPSLVDWNNDGLQDLIVGQGGGEEPGKIRVYLNFGAAYEPLFFAWFYVQSEGSDLVFPAAGCLGCFPRVVYWDGDWRKDLIVGQADGTIKVFLNNGTDEIPTFDSGTLLKAGAVGFKKNIDVGDRATPTIVDWNNDGIWDIVSGALDGKIHVYINNGTNTNPDYISETFVKDNGLDLKVAGGRSSPEVIDLDHDGAKDILTGNTEGQLLFYRNIGTDQNPEFDGYTYVESNGIVLDLAGSPRSRPFISYWTSDYYLDVLVGSGDGKVRLYQELPMLLFRIDK